MIPEYTNYFGFPKHGFMDDAHANPGIYDEPGGTKLHDYYNCGTNKTWQSNNSISLLKVPGIAEVGRTSEGQARDAANNYEWRNYSLIINNTLNGKNLNFHGTGSTTHSAIYIDGNKVPWGISVYVRPSKPFKVSVYLQCLFGRFSTFRTFPTQMSKLLAEHEDAGIGWGITTPQIYNSTGHVLTRNSTGSRMFAHLYGKCAGTDPLCQFAPFHCEEDSWLRLWGVFDIQISGNGLVSDIEAELGSGITAVVSTHKTEAECRVEVDEGDGYDYSYSLEGGNSDYQGETFDYPDCPDCSSPGPHRTTSWKTFGNQQDTNNLDWTETKHYLFRCGFDDNDNPVTISMEWELINKYEWTCNVIEDEIYEVDITYTGGWSCISELCRPDDTDVRSETVVGYTGGTASFSAYNTLGVNFYRNGSKVIDYHYKHLKEFTEHGTIDLLALGFPWSHAAVNVNHDETITETVGGDIVSSQPNEIIGHVYSLDVLGAMARDHVAEGESEYTLSNVITPNGVDSSHSGTVISRTMALELIPPPLGGTYQPETNEIVWYVEGVTDQGEDHTFSFV